MQLYRAVDVDSDRNTLEFTISSMRDAQAARRFFGIVLRARHTVNMPVAPCVLYY